MTTPGQKDPRSALTNVQTKRWVNSFRQKLLAWYSTNKRDLPWRHTLDPYHIWVSEVMLQQTQVDIVIPYYRRFLSKFPNISILAQASLSEVLKLWEGLGYYGRARNLHTAAKKIVAEYNGLFPQALEKVCGLPGVGPYISAAVLSIAFNYDIAAVDGNVQRVISRVFAIDSDLRKHRTKKTIRQIAQQLLLKGQAGDYNQAIMELGARICMPTPRCPTCPVSSHCQSFKTGNPKSLPYKSPIKPRPHYVIAVGLVWRDGQLLVARRFENGLLGGLWELPGGKWENGENLEDTVKREIYEELGIKVSVLKHFMAIDHTYTHFTITMHAYHCQYRSGTPQALGCEDWQWATPAALRKLAFPRANTKLFEKLWAELDS